jgi:hypothetical protein
MHKRNLKVIEIESHYAHINIRGLPLLGSDFFLIPPMETFLRLRPPLVTTEGCDISIPYQACRIQKKPYNYKKYGVTPSSLWFLVPKVSFRHAALHIVVMPEPLGILCISSSVLTWASRWLVCSVGCCFKTVSTNSSIRSSGIDMARLVFGTTRVLAR